MMTVENVVVDLLVDKAPARARDLMLGWAELRNSSWADAAREAEARAASGGHLPQIRGQLRYHYGEAALAEACRNVGVGVIPFRTNPPGGVFMVSRIGRFGLVSLTTPQPGLMPRRSITRRMLSEANDALDPQERLDLGEKPKVVTELAYFGCLTAVPSRADPSAPAVLAFGVPNAELTQWLAWIPLHRLHALLQEKMDSFGASAATSSNTVPDIAFPKFKVPRRPNKKEGDGNQ